MERGAAASLLAPDLRRALEDHDPFDAFEAHYARPGIECPLYRVSTALPPVSCYLSPGGEWGPVGMLCFFYPSW